MIKWSLSAPENHNNKVLILKGLVAQAGGEEKESIELFSSAAKEAESYHFIHYSIMAIQFLMDSKKGLSVEDKEIWLAKKYILKSKWLS
jgi:hypothetical protein